MSAHLYVQCRLQKGSAVQVSWIPKEFADTGRDVKLKANGSWDNGWRVTDVYPTAVRTHEEVIERSQDYKRTRRASDI